MAGDAQKISDFPREFVTVNRQMVEHARDERSMDEALILLGAVALYGIEGPDIERDPALAKHLDSIKLHEAWKGMRRLANMSILSSEKKRSAGKTGGRPKKSESTGKHGKAR